MRKVGRPVASNQTFQKRQKEMARKEKQRAKAERKAQRKLEKESPVLQEVGGDSEPSSPGDTVEAVSSDAAETEF